MSSAVVLTALCLVLVTQGFLHVTSLTEDTWRRLRHSSGIMVNRTRLLQAYSSVCPVQRQQCDSGLQDYPLILQNSTENLPCWLCSCHRSCVIYKSCCPGMSIGYVSHQCVAFHPHLTPDPPRFFLAVNTCDGDSDTGLKNACENSVDDIPVTSTLTEVTYKNRHCALCNNDTDFESWELSVECDSTFDRSALETADSLKQALQNNSCRIGLLSVPLGSGLHCSPSDRASKVIDTCNVTGLWTRFDPDIDWACQNLQSTFHGFKNVFCYLCNPSLASSLQSQQISECNVTGDWQRYDPEIENGCLTQPVCERFHPFKNVYCLYCNGLRLENTIRKQSSSVIVEADESFSPYNVSKLDVTVSFEYAEPIPRIQAALASVAMAGNVPYEINTRTEDQLNSLSDINSLEYHHESVCGDSRKCGGNDTVDPSGTRSFPWASCRWCSCDTDDCVEQGNCCLDVLLKIRPYTCLSDGETSGSSSIAKVVQEQSTLVISRCLDPAASDWLRQKCENNSQDQLDVFSKIPVLASHDLPYRNIYCWRCSNNIQYAELKLSVTCKTFFEVVLFVDLPAMLDFLAANCQVRFDLPKSSKQCAPNTKTEAVHNQPNNNPNGNTTDEINHFYQCNMTGNWFEKDTNDTSGIIAACQTDALAGLPSIHVGGREYRNVFCFICNPEQHHSSITVDRCNATGNMTLDSFRHDTSLDPLCAARPEYSRWRPYKNVYCMMCNTPTQTSGSEVIIGGDGSSSVDGETIAWAGSNYRKIFSLDPRIWRLLDEAHPECTHGTYDHTAKSCRELYCSEGRILQDGACVTFTQQVDDLQYFMPMVLRVTGLTSTTMDSFYLDSLCQAVQSHIIETNTDHSIIHFDDCRIRANQQCIYDNNWRKGIPVNANSSIYLTTDISVSSTNDRNLLENNLVKAATGTVYRIETVANSTTLLQRCTSNVGAAGETISGDQCVQPWTILRQWCEFSTLPFEGIRVPITMPGEIRIGKLLVCPRVKLGAGEYVTKGRNGAIKLVKDGKMLTSDEYIPVEHFSVLVCEEDYVGTKNFGPEDVKEHALFNRVHSLFSLLCTSLSVLCLLATFITYSVLPSLRTLPGKNNMSLVACLAVAQASLRIGFYETDKTPCMVLGMVLHFSWLASFCAMNVCSFHMFRVFCSRSPHIPTATTDRRTFLKYTLYILGMPAFGVAATAAFSLIQSGGHDTGYGQHFCFISNYYAVASAFIAPVIAIFVTNIVFFILTFCKIHKSPAVRNTAGDRRELVLYVKLCTLTGITWPLMIVDATLDVSAFSYVVTVLNGLQGLFIFVSYVCNKRVVNLYRQKTRRSPGETSMTFSDTTNTTMSAQL